MIGSDVFQQKEGCSTYNESTYESDAMPCSFTIFFLPTPMSPLPKPNPFIILIAKHQILKYKHKYYYSRQKHENNLWQCIQNIKLGIST